MYYMSMPMGNYETNRTLSYGNGTVGNYEYEYITPHKLTEYITKFEMPVYDCTKKFEIQKAIFNDPATIVFWKDGSKTIVKCGENDTYNKEAGLALCFMKKALGNEGNFNNVLRKFVKYES